MRSLLRAHRARRNEDHGFSLVEMLVTIVIFGIIGTMLSVWFIAGMRSTSKMVSRNDDVLAGRAAMQRLTSDLQLAVADPNSEIAGPFIGGSHDSVTFYARLSNDEANPTKVIWSVTPAGTYNGTLVRTTIAPYVSGTTVTYPTTGGGAQVRAQNVLRGVNNRDDGKIPDIFRFLDATNAARPLLCADVVPAPTASVCTSTYASPLTSDPLTASSPLVATDDAAEAVAVEIYLQFTSAADGVAGNNAPFYETSPKSGVPAVQRARVYPISNTAD